MDLQSEAIAARMIEDKIRDEWIKIGGKWDCRAVVNYIEEAGEWEARPVRNDLTLNDRRAFVTAVNRVIHQYKLIIKAKLAPPL